MKYKSSKMIVQAHMLKPDTLVNRSWRLKRAYNQASIRGAAYVWPRVHGQQFRLLFLPTIALFY